MREKKPQAFFTAAIKPRLKFPLDPIVEQHADNTDESSVALLQLITAESHEINKEGLLAECGEYVSHLWEERPRRRRLDSSHPEECECVHVWEQQRSRAPLFTSPGVSAWHDDILVRHLSS